MIYLTAQRVRSRRAPASAINCYLHRRPGEPIPAGSDSLAVADAVARDPGALAATDVRLRPGGNRVEAFLDVVGPDDLDAVALRPVLADFEARVGAAATNELGARSAIGVLRLYVGPTLELLPVYRELRAAAEELLSSARPASAPLVVRVDHRDDASVFELEKDSVERVRTMLGPSWTAPRVRVAGDVAADFAAYHGSILPHLVVVLTGMDGQRVREMGGIRFENSQGNVIGRWPPS